MSTLAFTACFAVWTIFSIIGVQIKQDLGLSDTQFGLLVGTPILTGSLSRIFLGIWTDQYGGRIVNTVTMLAAAAATFALTYATTYSMMLVAALGIGLAGGSFSAGIAYVFKWFPVEKQGTALGIFGMGNVGAAVTKFTAPFVMVAFGWIMVAKVWAIVLVIMAVVFWLTTEDEPALKARRLSGEKPRGALLQLEPLKNLQVWRFATYYFFVFGGEMYFSASAGSEIRDLWKSDGTAEGTVMVKNINPSMGSNPDQLTVGNGMLYFSATDGTSGHELWKSDGTEAGTFLVKDINQQGNSNSTPQWITPYESIIYFASTDGTHGTELWRSDGSTENTEMIADINSAGSSDPSNLLVVDDVLYFSATDGVNGHELWKLDISTGIYSISNNNSFTIAPNPVIDRVNIFIEDIQPAHYDAHIYNSIGQHITSKNIGNINYEVNETIDVQNLISGIYTLKIVSSRGEIMVRQFYKY